MPAPVQEAVIEELAQRNDAMTVRPEPWLSPWEPGDPVRRN
jgi:hypothetical protein